MARLAGVDLPREKRLEIALTYIYGIGRTRAQQTLKETGVSPDVGAAYWIALPLLLRLPAAVILVVWGARTNRPWTLPTAAMLALPVLWLVGLAMLTAAFARTTRRCANRSTGRSPACSRTSSSAACSTKHWSSGQASSAGLQEPRGPMAAITGATSVRCSFSVAACAGAR